MSAILEERCFSCGMPPPTKPKCRMCQRVMEDWPDDPEKFLTENGWERSEHTGNWLEPLKDCTFPVSDEMVAEAQKRLDQAITYSEFDHVVKSKGLLKEAQQNIETAKDNLARIASMRDRGERTDLQSLTDTRFFGTASKTGKPIREGCTTLSHRARNEHVLWQAVRMELNRSIPAGKPRKLVTPRYSDAKMEAMERSYLAKDHGVLRPDSRQKLADKGAEVSEVYAEQCVFCRRWPDTLE